MHASRKKRFTREDVEYIAALANLLLTSREKKKFPEQLAETLKYIEKLQDIETKDVVFPPQLIGLKNVFRNDQVTQSLPQHVVLSGAFRTHKGYFLVDSVFGEE